MNKGPLTKFSTREIQNNLTRTWVNYLGYCQSRAPLLLENVKTDATIAVDVRVENLSTEGHLCNTYSNLFTMVTSIIHEYAPTQSQPIINYHILTRIRKNLIKQIVTHYLRWLEWIIRWEMNGYKKYTPSKWAVWWAHNCCLPMEHVISNRACKIGSTQNYKVPKD